MAVPTQAARILSFAFKSAELGGQLAAVCQNVNDSSTTLTATTILEFADSGSTYSIDQDAAFSINLPNPTSGAGLKFTFVITDAGANDVDILVSDSGATFYGTIINDVTSVLPVSNKSTIRFASGVSAVGDTVTFESISDTKYFVSAVTSANGGITAP